MAWIVKLTNPYTGEYRILKRYPFKIQCVIWCFMQGYVCSGGTDFGPYKELYFYVYWPAADAKLTVEEENPNGRV